MLQGPEARGNYKAIPPVLGTAVLLKAFCVNQQVSTLALR